MNNITFESVTCANFRSIGATPITVDLNRHPTTVITGQNGGGKSTTTIIALDYVLFGKSYTGCKVAMLINSTNNKKSTVEVEFSKGSDKYRVIRGQKPSVFEIYKNGELIKAKASNAENQAELESILGMDRKIFHQVVILNKAKYEPFMQMGVADRRHIVEQLLDIDILSKMGKVAGERLKELKVEIKDTEHQVQLKEQETFGQKRVIETAQNAHKALIAAAKDKVNNVQRQIGVCQSNITTQQRIITQTQSSLSNYDSGVQVIKNEITNIDNEIHETFESVKEPFKMLENVKSKVKEMDDEIESKKYESMSLTREIERLTKQISFYSQEHCPTCKQSITDETRKSMVDEAQAVVDENGSKVTQITEYLNENGSKVSLLKATIQKVESAVEKTKQLTNKKKLKQAELDGLQGMDEQYRTTIKNAEDNIAMQQGELDKLNSELASANAELESNEIDVQDLGNEHEKLRLLENETKDLKDVNMALHKKLSHLSLIQSRVRDDGVKKNIISEYIPFINKRVNTYLNDMDFYINFMLDEDFNESVHVPTKEKFQYENFSDGQMRRIDLAIMLTWLEIARMKNSVSTNLLIMDEILENLDSAGVTDVINLFRTHYTDMNLFVITQRPEFVDLFKSNINYKLTDGFTEVA